MKEKKDEQVHKNTVLNQAVGQSTLIAQVAGAPQQQQNPRLHQFEQRRPQTTANAEKGRIKAFGGSFTTGVPARQAEERKQ